MGKTDYACRFHAAVAKASEASDSGVRLAYFDLAEFYHGKLRDRASASEKLLHNFSREGRVKKQCWCR